MDRYVGLSFVKAFAMTLLVFSISGVMLDWFGRVGYMSDAARVESTFAEGFSQVKIFVLFYMAYLPFLLKQVLPFVAVAAALMTVNHMVRYNEVMPILAAGVSARRLFAPLFLCGLAISAGHFAFNEFLLPSLSREQIALKRFFSGDRKIGLRNLAHLRDGKGTVTRASGYNFSDQSLTEVTVHRPWTKRGFDILSAPRLDPAGEAWVATDGAMVHPADIAAPPRELPPGTRVDFGVSPDDVEALASKQGTAEISFTQLRRLVKKFPERRNLRVAMHKQITRPLTTFVLLMVGVPFLLASGRRRFMGMALTIAVCGGYYLLDIFFTSLGDRGDLPPLMAAYLPLALVFSLGVARLATLRI